MTTQNLHAGINIELQEINTFAEKGMLPQELDWFINKEVLKYINKKLNPNSNISKEGFEDTIKRTLDLKELVKTSPVLYTGINDEGNGIVSLPSDLYIPIRTDIMLATNCKTIKNKTKKLYRTEIKINIDSDVLTNFKVELGVDGGLKVLFDYKDLPPNYLKSLDFKKQAFMLYKALKIKLPLELNKILTSPYNLYWEFDKDKFISNTFILYTEDVIYNNVVTFNNVGINSTVKEIIVDTYDKKDYPLTSKVRIAENEFYLDAVNSHLSKSSLRSPVGRIYGQVLEVAKIKSVVMGGLRITYICKPMLADLLLNSNVNMNENSLNEILVNTVAYIKSVITSKNYQVYKQESILIE